MRKHLAAVLPVQGQGQLRGQQAVAGADIVAPAGIFERQVLLVPGQLGQRGGKGRRIFGRVSEHAPQDADHRGSQHVDAEEAKIMAGAKPGDQQALFGLGGGGLFDHRFHPVEAGAARHAAAGYRAEPGQQVLPGCLDSGDRARLGFGQFHQALGAALRRADIQVVAHQVEKGIAAGKFARAVDGVAVSERLGLRNEADGAAMTPCRLGVAFFVAGPDDHADLLHVRVERLFDQDAEDGFLLPVAVDQGLQRKRPLVLPGGGDDRFLDLQVSNSLFVRLRGQL